MLPHRGESLFYTTEVNTNEDTICHFCGKQLEGNLVVGYALKKFQSSPICQACIDSLSSISKFSRTTYPYFNNGDYGFYKKLLTKYAGLGTLANDIFIKEQVSELCLKIMKRFAGFVNQCPEAIDPKTGTSMLALKVGIYGERYLDFVRAFTFAAKEVGIAYVKATVEELNTGIAYDALINKTMRCSSWADHGVIIVDNYCSLEALKFSDPPMTRSNIIFANMYEQLLPNYITDKIHIESKRLKKIKE